MRIIVLTLWDFFEHEEQGVWEKHQVPWWKTRTPWRWWFFQIAVVLLLSHVWLFATPRTASCQASLSFTMSQSLIKLMSIELVMPSNHLILVTPFSSCLQSFPATGSFLVSQFLHQVAKVLEFQLQHQSFQWIFRTDLLVWSPCSSRDSQESSPTPQFKSINSSLFSLLYGPTLTSIDDHWKIIALTLQILLVMNCLCFLLCCLGLS